MDEVLRLKLYKLFDEVRAASATTADILEYLGEQDSSIARSINEIDSWLTSAEIDHINPAIGAVNRGER